MSGGRLREMAILGFESDRTKGSDACLSRSAYIREREGKI